MAKQITVAVGPLAGASATKVGLSQKGAIVGTNYFVLDGAAGSFTVNSVCASQTPGGAGALTLNGTLCSSVPTGTAIAYLPGPVRIYITGGSDESGKTFAVVGRRFTAAGGPYTVTETITGPNASKVSSQYLYDQIISITASAGTAGAITVGHYGTATLDVARQVIITSGGNDTGVTFTINGTDWANTAITENLTGASGGAATSALNYKTVTSVSSNGAIATTLTIGTNGVAASPWVRFDDYAANSQTTIAAVVSGTVSYDIQTCMDDPNDIGSALYKNPAGMTWIASLDTNVVGASATKASFFAYTPLWARVLLNSGTGSVTATFRQAYLQ